MLRRYIPRALAAPSRSFSTSAVLSRRQRHPAAAAGRKDTKARDGKEGKAKESAANPDAQREDVPGPDEKPMRMEDLYKMLDKLEGNHAAEASDPVSRGDKPKTKPKPSDATIGDGTLTPRESTAPNVLDPKDPLGLKGARPGPALFTSNMDPIFDFYEQDFDDETGATRRRVSHAQIAADRRTGDDLAAKVARLERDLRDAKRDDPLLRIQETLKAIARDELLTEPIRLLGDADPAEVNAAMDELRVAVPDVVRDMAVSGDEEQGRVAINAAQRLLHLNNALRHAFLATDEKQRPLLRAVLWKAYKSAKLRVPDFLQEIPPAAWDMLFYSQAVRWNRRRDACMAELLADMRRVGMDGPPTPPPDGKALPDFGDAEVEFLGGRRRRPGRRGAQGAGRQRQGARG
ncbi:uncharacterized protein J3D65DRAFT_685236 [Phyllosticta citribraziliensis]|uniref:Uncharacterized protein n=1 Tax=Phyllosticta citribraziliensis TaxID=989973 RepID=A0ABR1L9W1_9PEZI